MTESPETFKMVGMVHNQAELKALKDLIDGEAGGKEIEWDVAVPGGH